MPITPNTLFTTGAVLTSAQQNNFPRGVMALTTTTDNTLTGTTLTGLTTTFTAVANRNYRISVFFVTAQPVAGARFILSFTGSALRLMDYTVAIASFNNYFASSVQTYAAGLQTISVTLTQFGATNPSAGAGNPHQLVIEDIGTA